MTSSHTCPQYSQLKAVTAIARVQPAHRFQVIARGLRQAPYHGGKQAVFWLFQPPPPGLGRVMPQY
jgi:hypothetical protein